MKHPALPKRNVIQFRGGGSGLFTKLGNVAYLKSFTPQIWSLLPKILVANMLLWALQGKYQHSFLKEQHLEDFVSKKTVKRNKKKVGFMSFFPLFTVSDVLIQCMSTTKHSNLN